MFELKEVTKRYQADGREVLALDRVDLQIKRGEFVAVIGRSGSGKSTLLMLLGGMNRPSSGNVNFDGSDLYALDAKTRAAIRARRIGFVFQTFHLIPYLSAFHNVLLPMLADAAIGGQRRRAHKLLRAFDLERRSGHRPAQLSVGERQRVALARALLSEPDVILADEPTGNLDPESSQLIMDELRAFQKGGGTVVLVTHDRNMAQYASRSIQLENGAPVA